MLHQDLYALTRRAHETEYSCESRKLKKSYYLKNYGRQDLELPPQCTATSQSWLHHFKVNFDMSKSPNKYGGVLVSLRVGYKLFLGNI